MKNSLGILVVAIIIAIYELPSLIKSNLKREIWVFSILLILGLTLGITKSLDISIPNPLDILTIIYKPFNDLLVLVLN